MANIPVEKTGGVGFWPWLIGLLALLLVGWLALELFDDEPDADELAGMDDNVGVVDPVELDDPGLNDGTAVITTIEPLYEGYGTGVYAEGTAGVEGAASAEGAGDSRVGQTVDLTGVPVLSVVGDSAFFVGNNDNQRVLVVLETLGESETYAPGPVGSDGAYDIDEGDTVSIDGTVTRYEEGARGTWELPEADRQRMLKQGLYVRVNSRADIEVNDDAGA